MAHGNSYENEELHHLYEIIDRVDDSVFKYGISFKPIGKDGLSNRIREQVNLVNRIDKWQRFLCQEKHAFVMNIQCLVELFFGRFGKRRVKRGSRIIN